MSRIDTSIGIINQIRLTRKSISLFRRSPRVADEKKKDIYMCMCLLIDILLLLAHLNVYKMSISLK